jgi:Homeodomain-like domain
MKNANDQAAALRLARAGMPPLQIATALGLDVDQVRAWLEPPATLRRLGCIETDDDIPPGEAA